MSLAERHKELTELLTRHGQAHLLRFYDRLDGSRRRCLLDQIEAVDWEELARLITTHVRSRPPVLVPERVEPAPYLPKAPPPELRARYDAARSLGESLLADGRVAVFTVAGGQGTRLGWDGPKGTFPATPVTGKSLFQVHAERILKAQATYGAEVPWYLMTSPLNHVASRDFFAAHGYFGLRAEQVVFLQQGTMPSVALDGRVLLADHDRLAVNPDGTGGSFRALYRSGALDDMTARGVSAISYFQVDNPNAKLLDPLFVGLHAGEGAEMSSKTLRKAGPDERVGTMALLDGRLAVIEYSDIPRELAEARHPDGSYRFDAGSIAMHVIAPEFVRRLEEGGMSLPFHRADKRVDHLDDDGNLLVPATDNAVKLEMFVFDALPLARAGVVLETDRVEEFAPIKNAHGDDSPASSKRLQSERAARWLERHGVEIPRTDEGELDAVIELSPLTAATDEDLRGAALPERVLPGEVLVL
jgi:UDP-N-acetylglucosamine/UDP-N-acetylgalactosamine diphosphorylase